MKSDTQLQHDVMAELKWEPSVDATDIGVTAADGVVTLTGHVSSFGEKWHAEAAAQRVAGVNALAVELKVSLGDPSARNDADIAAAVENTLMWTTCLPRDAVKVMVEGGWVTLTGEVDWEYQRQAAAGSVRYLVGVKDLSNQIALRPKLSSIDVKADIEAALLRRAKGEAQNIAVEVHGNTVTLTGTVHSWSERDLATHSAWGTSGVRQVFDQMRVVS
jgi:osmotically-inducible protein OsmY